MPSVLAPLRMAVLPGATRTHACMHWARTPRRLLAAGDAGAGFACHTPGRRARRVFGVPWPSVSSVFIQLQWACHPRGPGRGVQMPSSVTHMTNLCRVHQSCRIRRRIWMRPNAWCWTSGNRISLPASALTLASRTDGLQDLKAGGSSWACTICKPTSGSQSAAARPPPRAVRLIHDLPSINQTTGPSARSCAPHLLCWLPPGQ